MLKIALHRTMVKAKLNFAACEGIQNPDKFCLWDRESWVLKFGIQFKKSGIKLTIAIQNPSSTYKDWNQVPGIRNPRREI